MVGETVSHYRIIAEIGAGGMGVVYKAEDLRLGRLVALKFLPPQLVRDPDAKRRFFQEARTASAIDHVNVCTIHDIEETTDGRVFLSMAYCDGETLKKRLERGPLAATEAVRVALQVARGLARAHQAGIVHRDVKPGNIMVTTEGEAKLLDFGIAKITSGGDLTRTGTTLGTIAYMAPEHVRGGDADERSDVWALGVVLYEMLAGRRPFSGANDYELLQAIVDRPQAPLTGVAGVTDDIARVVERALDKARDRRYANAGELVHALEACVPASGPASGLAGSTRVMPWRQPWAIGALAGAVVVVAAVVALWVWRSSGTRWARNVALPEILRLADLDRNGEAFLLATQAETRIAGDPVLNGLWARISRQVSITTTPAGADVSLRLIGGDTTWHPVGRTPLVNTRLPRGVFWWRFEKAGYEPIEIVRATDFTVLLPGFDGVVALPTPGSHPPGMVAVSVPPGGMRLTLTGFDYTKVVPAPDYYIDRHEVTNAEFKAFVDAGGYEKREVLDGALRARGSDARLDRGHGPLPRWHRTPGAVDLAGRHLPGRPGGLAGGGGELVRSRGVRGIPREALADDLSLDARGEAGAWQFDHALESLRRRGYGARWAPRPVSGPTGPSTWPATSRSGSGTSRPAPASATSSAARGTIRTTSFSTRIPGRRSTGPTRTGFAAWPTATARRHRPPSPRPSRRRSVTTPPSGRWPTPCIGSTRTSTATIARHSTCGSSRPTTPHRIGGMRWSAWPPCTAASACPSTSISRRM